MERWSYSLDWYEPALFQILIAYSSGPDINNLDGIRSHETPSLSLIAKNGMIQLFAGTESLKQETFTNYGKVKLFEWTSFGF